MPLRSTERSNGRKRPRWKDGSQSSDGEPPAYESTDVAITETTGKTANRAKPAQDRRWYPEEDAASQTDSWRTAEVCLAILSYGGRPPVVHGRSAQPRRPAVSPHRPAKIPRRQRSGPTGPRRSSSWSPSLGAFGIRCPSSPAIGLSPRNFRSRQPLMLLLLGAGAGDHREKAGLLSHRRDNEPAARVGHGLVRPALSEPGHHCPSREPHPHTRHAGCPTPRAQVQGTVRAPGRSW